MKKLKIILILFLVAFLFHSQGEEAWAANPTGWLDVANCTSFAGWAGDPDNPRAQIDVHFYYDVLDSAHYLGATTANLQREAAVCQALGGTNCAACPSSQPQCLHGFSFTTPAILNNGANHTIYAFGINLGGTPGGNVQLSGSPKTINCYAVGGYIKNCSTGAGISGVQVQIYDNNVRSTVTVSTDSNGFFKLSNLVASGHDYAVRPQGVPSGYVSPVKTTQLVYTYNICTGNDTPLNSGSYECQRANNRDCASDHSGGQRCNFCYSPTVAPTPPPTPTPTPGPTNYFSLNPAGVVSSTNFSGNIAGKMSVPLWQVEDDSERFSGFGTKQAVYGYQYFYERLNSPTFEDFVIGPYDLVGKPSVPPKNGLAYYHQGDLTSKSSWKVNSGEKMIFLINGNLRVSGTGNAGFTVDPGGFLAFVVSGNITFDPNIGNNPASANRDNPVAEGVLIADGTIDTQAGVSNHERFVGRGMFVADANLDTSGGFSFGRDLGNYNTQYAAEYFEYRPDFLVNFPQAFGVRTITWREVAP